MLDEPQVRLWDNAPMESFFATLKGELVEQRNYFTRDEARADVFQYVEGWYPRLTTRSQAATLRHSRRRNFSN